MKKIEGKLLPRFLLHGGEEYTMNDKLERQCLISVLKMMPGRKDNHPNAEQQFPSGARAKITRGGPFI